MKALLSRKSVALFPVLLGLILFGASLPGGAQSLNELIFQAAALHCVRFPDHLTPQVFSDNGAEALLAAATPLTNGLAGRNRHGSRTETPPRSP